MLGVVMLLGLFNAFIPKAVLILSEVALVDGNYLAEKKMARHGTRAALVVSHWGAGGISPALGRSTPEGFISAQGQPGTWLAPAAVVRIGFYLHGRIESFYETARLGQFDA